MNDGNANRENIEQTLERYYQAASPSSAFLKELEMQLIEAEKEMELTSKQPTFLEKLTDMLFGQQRSRWVFAPAAIALLMLAMVLTIGPSRVLAEVQGWLRYVPGYGFVGDDAARALASPITSTKDGVTVSIKQVYADSQETYLVIGVEGGPSKDEIYEYMQPLPEEDLQTRVARIQGLYETDARLILPDGTVISDLSYGGGYWDGFFVFEELPANVLEATFEIGRLAGVPNGWLPEGWSFDLSFEYVDKPVNLVFPEPKIVDAVSAMGHGMRARVRDVVYAETEISIRVDFDGLYDDWTLLSAYLDARLEDELGREYPIIYGPRSGRDQDGIYTITFRPPQSDAQELTLSIASLFVEVGLQDRVIRVDFGEDPAIGDTFELNSSVDVLGQQVLVKSVSLLDEPPFVLPSPHTEDEPTDTVSFELIVPEKEAGVEIHGLNFGRAAHGAFGKQVGGVSGSLSGAYEPGQNRQIVLTIDIPSGEPLPSGTYDLPLEGATVLLEGPFQITWKIQR